MRRLTLGDAVGDHLRWAFNKPQAEVHIADCVALLEEELILTLGDLQGYDFSSFPGKAIFARHLAWIIPRIPRWEECHIIASALQDWWEPLKGDPCYLWNVREAYNLLWPGENAPGRYEFVGRTASQLVYDRIRCLQGETTYLRIVGAKGSGKTSVVASVCSHIHQAGLKKIVYVDAEAYVLDPFRTLQGALLLALYGQESAWLDILRQADITALEDWSRCSGGKELVFVVDDWESLDAKDDDSEALKGLKCQGKSSILRARKKHPLVLVTSVNSKEHISRLKDDKEALVDVTSRLEIDGPFNYEELQTWLGIAKFPSKQQQDMEFLTGAMPRLLDFFKVASWDVNKYLQHINLPYTSKLWSEFIGKLSTARELDAASALIFKGQLRPELVHVKQTCFYSRGDGTLEFLCPYLEAEAKRMLMARYSEVENAALRIGIDKWVQVAELDLRRQLTPQRTPRIGWNVEGLVLDIMRHQRRVFVRDENTVFKHCVEYSKGGEAQACLDLLKEELEEGVLLVPIAFDEKAIDALFVIVRESVLHFYALQITIAKWKLKSKKDSHLVWKTEVLPAWRSQFEQPVQDKYYYIMPENIKEADLPPGEQGEATVQFRTLADVRENLKLLDAKLMLTEPDILPVRDMNFCMGRNSDNCTPCRNWVENGGYCRLHRGSAPKPDEGLQLYFKKQRIE